MSALIASQICCMFMLLIGTLLFGISPVWVKKTLFTCDCGDVCKTSCRARKGKLITSFLIYFGGGVLLGTTFLHLLPEAREGFEEEHKDPEPCNCTTIAPDVQKAEEHEHHESFPLPEFIVCMGFFAVYLFEEVIHYFLGGHTHVPPQSKAIRSMSRSGSYAPSHRGSVASYEKHPEEMRATTPPVVASTSANNLVSCPDSTLGQTFSLAALLTVAALSFHSLFEGFAVGLRPDATSTWIVFGAIAVHKYVIAFVVGLEVLATGGKNMHVYTYMSVFAAMSPLGMAIAMITQNNVEDSSPMVVSVLNAIATGTLLYVTFFEILQRDEHKEEVATWVQLIATSSGFALMAIMQYASTFA